MPSRDKRLTITCDSCGHEFTVAVDSAGYRAWKGGMFIQNAFPYLSADQRELLMSGTCGPCFDSMFPPDQGELEEEFGDVIRDWSQPHIWPEEPNA